MTKQANEEIAEPKRVGRSKTSKQCRAERHLMDRAEDEAISALQAETESVLSEDEQWLSISYLRAQMLQLNRGRWDVARESLERLIAKLVSDAREKLEKLGDASLVSLHDLGLPLKVAGALERCGISTLAHLQATSDKQLMKVSDIGLLTVSEIRLAEKRWSDQSDGERRRVQAKLNGGTLVGKIA